MGMYTEIYVNVDLMENTPDHVIETLRMMCGDIPEDGRKLPHERWWQLFSNNSFYLPLTECAKITFNDIRGGWSLLGKGDIKNYEGEIQAFFDWIKPFVDAEGGRTFIGYHRYEESIEPTLVYTGDPI